MQEIPHLPACLRRRFCFLPAAQLSASGSWFLSAARVKAQRFLSSRLGLPSGFGSCSRRSCRVPLAAALQFKVAAAVSHQALGLVRAAAAGFRSPQRSPIRLWVLFAPQRSSDSCGKYCSTLTPSVSLTRSVFQHPLACLSRRSFERIASAILGFTPLEKVSLNRGLERLRNGDRRKTWISEPLIL